MKLKKNQCWLKIIGALFFVLTSASLLYAESLQLGNIKIYSTELPPQTLSQDSKVDEAAEGFIEEPLQNQMITSAASLVHLKVSGEENVKETAAELGRFEYQISVKSKTENVYPVEMTLNLRLPSGRVKPVTRNMDVSAEEPVRFEDRWAQDFIQSFAELSVGEYMEYDDQYGVQFQENLRNFSLVYAEKFLDEAPRMIQKMITKQIASQPVGKSQVEIAKKSELKKEIAKEPAIEKSSLFLLNKNEKKMQEESPKLERSQRLAMEQEKYKAEEYIDFTEADYRGQVVSIPRYNRRVFFKLNTLSTNKIDRYPLGEVEYIVSTSHNEKQGFRSEFKLNFKFLLREAVSHTQVYEHEAYPNGNKMAADLNNDLFQKTAEKLIDLGGTEANISLKKIFIANVEPYMDEAFYDFLPFLAKAKVKLVDPSLDKKLEKYLKKKQKLSKKLADH